MGINDLTPWPNRNLSSSDSYSLERVKTVLYTGPRRLCISPLVSIASLLILPKVRPYCFNGTLVRRDPGDGHGSTNIGFSIRTWPPRLLFHCAQNQGAQDYVLSMHPVSHCEAAAATIPD